MPIINLDIVGLTESVIENSVKINGNVVNKVYFTRRMVRIQPSPANNNVVLLLPDGVMYILTNNQANINPEIYIVDTVDGVAPSSLLDLAFKLSTLMR